MVTKKKMLSQKKKLSMKRKISRKSRKSKTMKGGSQRGLKSKLARETQAETYGKKPNRFVSFFSSNKKQLRQLHEIGRKANANITNTKTLGDFDSLLESIQKKRSNKREKEAKKREKNNQKQQKGAPVPPTRRSVAYKELVQGNPQNAISHVETQRRSTAWQPLTPPPSPPIEISRSQKTPRKLTPEETAARIAQVVSGQEENTGRHAGYYTSLEKTRKPSELDPRLGSRTLDRGWNYGSQPSEYESVFVSPVNYIGSSSTDPKESQYDLPISKNPRKLAESRGRLPGSQPPPLVPARSVVYRPPPNLFSDPRVEFAPGEEDQYPIGIY